MAKETKQITARQALRARIQVRAAAKAAAKKTVTAAKKFATLRRIAFEEPQEVDGALSQLSEGFAELSEALNQMVVNLDMGDQGMGDQAIPATASLKAHIASKKNYAARFRRIAEEVPEQFGQALSEVYIALDGLTEDMEVAAENLGITLTPPMDEVGPGPEGIEPGPEGIESEPVGIPDETMDEPAADVPPEFGGGEDVVEEEKDASGSDWFSDDRDSNGQPKKTTASKKRASVVTRR
jgi:hypothetical protein